MSNTSTCGVGILEMPAEVNAIVLRHVFRGATIQLATPYSLPHIQQLVHINKALAVFAIEGLAGNIAEEVLLQEAIFAFTELSKFEENDLTQIPQVARITHVAAKPRPSEFKATVRCLRWFKSLKDATITVTPRMPVLPRTVSPRITILSEIPMAPLWTARQFEEQEKISLSQAARLKEKYRISLDIEFRYHDLGDGLHKVLLCRAQVSEGRLVKLAAPEAEALWSESIVDSLKLDKE